MHKYLFCLVFIININIIQAKGIMSPYPKFPDEENLIKIYNLAGQFNFHTHEIKYEQVSINEIKKEFPHLDLNEKNKYGFVFIYEKNKERRLGGGILIILCNLKTEKVIACKRSR